jgi:O-antigen ligase
MLKKNVFFGSGLGFISTKVLFVDNYFLKILGECGIVGFFAFVILFLSLIINSLKAMIKCEKSFDKEGRDLFACFFVSIFGFFITSFYMDTLTFTAATNVFWIILGLLACSITFVDRNNRNLYNNGQ